MDLLHKNAPAKLTKKGIVKEASKNCHLFVISPKQNQRIKQQTTMSSKPVPEEEGKKMPKSPMEWVCDTFNLRKSRSKSEENLRQIPQQKPNLQSKNKSQYENLKDRRNQERTSRTLNSNYKYIIQKSNTTTAQTKNTDIEEKELI